MQRFWTVLLVVVGFGGVAYAQNTGDAEARFNSAVVHLREGRVDMAIEEFKRAIKEDGKNPYFHKGLGLAFARKRRYVDAISELKKALELNPYYVDVHNDLGSVLVLAGKREEGKKEFLTGYNDPLNPSPEFSAYNLGQAYLEEENYSEALSWFRTSLGRSRSYSQPYLGIADVLVAQQRHEEAMAQLENGVKELPEDAGLHLALGDRYLKAGRFTDARSQLETALKKDPGGPVGQRAATLLKDLPK